MITLHRARGFVLAALALLCAMALAWNEMPAPANAGGSPHENAERDRLLGIGKDLFVARCASCHNERGEKALASGPPLNQRKLSREVIERNVAGRFKSATAEQRRAFALYIESFLAK